MKKKVMIICLAVLLSIGGAFYAFSGDDDVLCGCGCGTPVVEGTTHCGCGWEPTQA